MLSNVKKVFFKAHWKAHRESKSEKTPKTLQKNKNLYVYKVEYVTNTKF